MTRSFVGVENIAVDSPDGTWFDQGADKKIITRRRGERGGPRRKPNKILSLRE